ncbi:MAG: hypothetical protein KDK89_12280 [Alphaproteobacteria bacterium]|nr:hypothetical protein [Alphaproteobacteria bacterium]
MSKTGEIGYCWRAEENVSLQQSEQDCKQQHGCASGPCPLHSDFSEQSGIGKLWLGLGLGALRDNR